MNDLLRDHLDAVAPPLDIDLLVNALVAERRTDEMPVTTLEPVHEMPTRLQRRRRFGLAFTAAVIITIAAVGAVAWLGGNALEPADEPVDPPPTAATTQAFPTTTETPQTTATTATTQLPPPAAELVGLDPAADLAWAQQTITIGADGQIRVLYQRDESSVALATCADSACASPTITTVYENDANELGWVIGTPRSDGPVFWLGAGGGDAFSSLLVCADDTCADPVVIPFAGAANVPGTPSVTTSPEGIPLVSSMRGLYPSEVITFRCMEPTCDVDYSNWVTWSSGSDQFVGKAAVAQTDGPPVIAIASERSVFFGYCRHNNCRPESETVAGFETMVEVPVGAAVFRGPKLMLRPDGTPLAIVFVENGLAEDVVAVSCDTLACLEPTVTRLGTVEDGFSEWDAVLGPDGRLRVAWTDNGTLWLATCADEMCTAADVVEVAHPARDVAIEIGPAGFPILATSSPERGLELLLCADSRCSVTPDVP